MFKVLHSSAGAGKTHALVRHYLSHCIGSEDASAYRRVLALTFTNKAAGEMKERVVQYLERIANGVQDDARINDVVRHLEERSRLDREAIKDRAEQVLGHMLHHWGDVAIGTIDAFTRRVVRPFSRDLQLDHELRMTTEEVYYRERAVESLIAEAGIEPTVTGLLTEACLQLLHEERKWDPEKSLLELGNELGKEAAIAPLELLGSFTADKVVELGRTLRGSSATWRRQVNELGEKALRTIDDAGIKAEHIAYGSNGIHSYFKKLARFDDLWNAPGKQALSPLETGKWNSAKAGPAELAALDRISNELTDLFHRAELMREQDYRTYVIQRAVARELLTAFTLHSLDDHLWKVKQDDGVAFFSDLTRKVAQVVRSEPVPYIHERMGERYQHYLIDEFQDTSLLQWNSLLPLIDNALSSGGSALLVGDAKQAIYRWRNGEVRLFTGLPKIFGSGDDPVEIERERTLERTFEQGEPLDSNWRSARTIIEFNNELFASMATLLPADLQQVYAGHEQRVELKGKGLVHIRRSDKDLVGEDRRNGMLEFVLESLNEAIADGFSPGDVAVLVRSGRDGKAVAQHFIAHGIAVISPDGLQLAGDPVIELLIDLLRVIHSSDITAAARVMQYQAMLHAEKDQEQVDPFAHSIGLLDPLAHVRSWLKDHGSPLLRTTLTALVAELARAMDLRPAEDAAILTLLDEIHTFSTRHGQDIGGWLVHWERSGDRRSITAPDHGQAVRIMTIHKAKGLQFPVVIVPNVNMDPRGSHGERLWVDPGEAIAELPVALVRESAALRNIGLEELQEEDELRMLDKANLLYVAFTRPEQRLYALVPEAGADVLTKNLLEHIDARGDGDRVVLGERGGPWKSAKPVEHEMLRDVAGGSPLAALAIRLEAPDEWNPADPDPYRRAGNAIHDVLARTIIAEDLPTALRSVAREGRLDEKETDRLERSLGPLLSSELLEPWYGPGLTIWNEATLIGADGKAHRPDRVAIDGDVVRVLDIKTGKASPRHHDQVRGYMELMLDLGSKNVEGALLYLPEGELVIVHP